jgi:hypothetical protein
MLLGRQSLARAVASLLLAGTAASAAHAADGRIPTPEAYLGFKVGADHKLARWDKIVAYFQQVAQASGRVRYRDLGKSTNGNPFVLLEIASEATLKDLERFKRLERRLYFQDGAPSDAQKEELFRDGKAVVLITCNIHSTEIGASQMVLELVHELATSDEPRVRRILDNVIFLLVPSLNPDGQIMVVDWYDKNVGGEFEASPLPWLYHPYVGHDNNRDMYMFTQKESQMTARLLWHDWFPSVWLDEHQQGALGSRIFTMPATDPINPNVHPLIYRWNGLLGQRQGAALEAAGKEGIIYNATYTNFWQGAMAWSGWWHNQVGLLTEVASVRVASPTEQRKATLGSPPPPQQEDFQGQQRRMLENPKEPLPAPRDVMPRTEYPRPWLGGRWTLRDIVDYELIATWALLEAASDQRERLLRDIYEVNRLTVENGKKGEPAAILIREDKAHDAFALRTLVDKLRMGGVRVMRAGAELEADGVKQPAGTYVIPMDQVFARYAKDMLEKQTYPEVRRTPNAPPEPPYDVTAWSLGMLVGVEVEFVKKPLPEGAVLKEVVDGDWPRASVAAGATLAFDHRGTGSILAVNRLLKEGASVAFVGGGSPRFSVSGVARERVEAVARDTGVTFRADAGGKGVPVRARRVALYQPWTSNMDEGWTRWVLEQYGFAYTTVHNDVVKAGKLRDRFDIVLLADQSVRDIKEGLDYKVIRPEYRGGIGSEGVKNLVEFASAGGTLIAMGASGDLLIESLPIPVKNAKKGLTRDQHFAPGTLVRLQVDGSHPIGAGLPKETYGFYNNSPFYELSDGFSSQRTAVVARYPNTGLIASGWLKGEELMAGRAAVVAIEMNPGRVMLFGIRPQHRAQTLATFPMLFNALLGL